MNLEASYYEKLENNSVRCLLCPNFCVINDGKTGSCRVRNNREGKLFADAYGNVVSLAVDPVEKKPLYHFHPSSLILSTGVNGCNFRCGFCQNSEISQGISPTRHVEPEELAQLASQNDSIGVAFTYTEPFIWIEYIRDAGRLIRDRGLVNVLVTNGYVNQEPLQELLPLIDAMNVDIKSMKPDFYTKVCGGKLGDVLKTVETASRSCHVEVTNLVITNYNDTEEDFEKLTDWIYGIDPSIPLHLSRYSPRYRFAEPPTPVERLLKAYEIASAKLNYVYLGNVAKAGTGDTACPSCGNVLVKRSYYSVTTTGIKNGKCSSCGSETDFTGVD